MSFDEPQAAVAAGQVGTAQSLADEAAWLNPFSIQPLFLRARAAALQGDQVAMRAAARQAVERVARGVAAARGHHVRIVERADTLGGVAALVPHAEPLTAWLARECEDAGVLVQLERWQEALASTDLLLARTDLASDERLEALARSTHRALRRAIVANPNAPRAVLLALGDSFPALFWTNPAVALWLLEDMSEVESLVHPHPRLRRSRQTPLGFRPAPPSEP